MHTRALDGCGLGEICVSTCAGFRQVLTANGEAALDWPRACIDLAQAESNFQVSQEFRRVSKDGMARDRTRRVSTGISFELSGSKDAGYLSK